MSTSEEENERFALSGFCEASLSTAEFECSLENILDKKDTEATGPVWKMKLSKSVIIIMKERGFFSEHLIKIRLIVG